MASRCSCAVPGPRPGRPSEAHLAGATRITGHDGKRIEAATLMWLMETEEAEDFFSLNPATDDSIRRVQTSPKGTTERETS